MSRAAGSISTIGVGGTTRDCLAFEQRPSTPPDIRKFRRSANAEPGRRTTNAAAVDDIERMGLNDKVYGAASVGLNENAAQLINHSNMSVLKRMNVEKSEGIYNSVIREPLGQSYSRNHKLPDKFTEGEASFGTKSCGSDMPAKELIWPNLTAESLKGEEIYKRSHGSYQPGEQKSRGYTWKNDPKEMCFGAKGATIAFNGVSKNIADVLNSGEENSSNIITKMVDNYRGRGDILGQTRNLLQGSADRPDDIIYGRSSAHALKGRAPVGVGVVIKGKYSERDQGPDIDLGKSITPGFRNESENSEPTRVFGCPSIRTDLPNAGSGRRSLADAQNYGDDATAHDLIHPPEFASLAISSSAMTDPRTYEELVKLFNSIGYTTISKEVGFTVFEEACAACNNGDVHAGFASADAFKYYLNVYFEHEDTGRVADWLEAHGL